MEKYKVFVSGFSTFHMTFNSLPHVHKHAEHRRHRRKIRQNHQKNIGEEPPLCCFRLWGTAEIKSTAMAEKRMQ